MKKPRTILPTDHQITAANYVRDNFAELEAMRLNQVQMARWLSHVLGLKILNSHIGKINARAGVKFTQGKEGNLAPIPGDKPARPGVAPSSASGEEFTFITASGRSMSVRDTPAEELQDWIKGCTDELVRRASMVPQQAALAFANPPDPLSALA